MFSLMWTNGWVNNRDAGDLRRQRAHYDVTVKKGVREVTEFITHLLSEKALKISVFGVYQPDELVH